MSGIEVVGLVCAIISAFTATAELFKKRKKQKKQKERKEREKEKGRELEESLEKSLSRGPRKVQREYDYDFSRLGATFAKGDDVGRGQLKDILIDMQTKMIGTLQALLSGTGDLGSFHPLLDTSEESRIRSVKALGNQFQRLATAAGPAPSLEVLPRHEDPSQPDAFEDCPPIRKVLVVRNPYMIRIPCVRRDNAGSKSHGTRYEFPNGVYIREVPTDRSILTGDELEVIDRVVFGTRIRMIVCNRRSKQLANISLDAWRNRTGENYEASQIDNTGQILQVTSVLYAYYCEQTEVTDKAMKWYSVASGEFCVRFRGTGEDLAVGTKLSIIEMDDFDVVFFCLKTGRTMTALRYDFAFRTAGMA